MEYLPQKVFLIFLMEFLKNLVVDLWEKDWESSLVEIMGKDTPKIQIAPVLQNLIFPRSKEVLLKWLEDIKSFEDMEYLS